jgi:hypothetical protein
MPDARDGLCSSLPVAALPACVFPALGEGENPAACTVGLAGAREHENRRPECGPL